MASYQSWYQKVLNLAWLVCEENMKISDSASLWG